MYIAYAPLLPGEMAVGQFPSGARVWARWGKGLRAGWWLTQEGGAYCATGLHMHRDRFERALRDRIAKLPPDVDRDGYLIVWLLVVADDAISFCMAYYLSSTVERDPNVKPWGKFWPPSDGHLEPLKKPLPLSV